MITADERLDKLTDDFVEYCSERWECGKSMLVCIDKITCARMLQRIQPRWANEARRRESGDSFARKRKLAATHYQPTSASARKAIAFDCAVRRNGWRARSSR